MKQIFLSFQFIMLSALMNAYSDDNIFLTVQNDLKKDSVTSLNNVKESYKLSGKNLTALAEKILYKNWLTSASFRGTNQGFASGLLQELHSDLA